MLLIRNHIKVLCAWVLLASWLLAGCGKQETSTTPSLPTVTPTATPVATQTPTPFIPSPTPVPLAAKVNGEDITLAEFEEELARFQANQGNSKEEAVGDAKQQVLDDLINQVLLAQGAQEVGFKVDDDLLKTRMDELIGIVGGEQALLDWIAAQGYTEATFRRAFRRSIAAAWMRDKITADVPEAAEQVHARQILLYNSADAQDVLEQLKDGKDFATLAATYDPSGLGDLGWFPRGYLSDPLLEEAAFNLQPDEFSDVIENQMGFHILQVIEINPDRPLEPDARLILQEKALADWVDQQRSQSKIEVLLP